MTQIPPPPPGLRASLLRVGDQDLVVLQWPTPTAELPAEQLGTLTASERDIVIGVLRGLTSAELAEARRSSVRTVEKQVGSALRKLGVGSRRELRARFAGLK